MPSCLYEYKALVNAYKCEITEKSHFLVVNGYKYEEDTSNLLHIYVRHLTQPEDAIKAFFSGTTTWNDHYQRYETVSETHTIYWFWIDEQAKKVIVITCFN